MRKTVEVEYVGIEDLQEILDDAYAVIKEGHHVFFNVNSMSTGIRADIYIMLGGFETNKEYDFAFSFRMTDEAADVQRMNECKHVLKNLLLEE